jgi:hypothetical protein
MFKSFEFLLFKGFVPRKLISVKVGIGGFCTGATINDNWNHPIEM